MHSHINKEVQHIRGFGYKLGVQVFVCWIWGETAICRELAGVCAKVRKQRVMVAVESSCLFLLGGKNVFLESKEEGFYFHRYLL